jgi:hypothetical protein
MKKQFSPSIFFLLVAFACSTPERQVVREELTIPSVTKVTDENYSKAETQTIFTNYTERIKKTGSPTGTGVFLHRSKAIDVKDTTVMRPNFDTQYSFAILDLTEPATLTMPETGGRYQSTWMITEEHYNPIAFVKPGSYHITEENMGSKHVMIVARTQVNMTEPEDRNIALSLQKQLKLEHKNPGNYTASHKWHMDEILTMRKKYQAK